MQDWEKSFWTLGPMQSYFDARQASISPAALISPKATVTGKVIIEYGVKVMEYSVIRGPVHIGRNTIIGNNCLIRDHTYIGDDCMIGCGTEITRSWVKDRCELHRNYVGDSVICEGCLIGAGTVLANKRLDGKTVKMMIDGKLIDTGQVKLGCVIGRGCKIGVNCSIMPGVRIAAGSVVLPQRMVKRNVE